MEQQNLPPQPAMPRPRPVRPRTPSRWPWLLLLLLIAVALLGVWVFSGPEPGQRERQRPAANPPQAQAPAPQAQAAPVIPPPAPSQQGPVVDVTPEPPGEAPGLPSAEQAQRKQPYGLEHSLDAVVRSDEAIRLGDRMVPVAELERKLVVEGRGALLDRPLDKRQAVTAWGVHAVRPGDSLWKIHYALLREYMAHRGQALPAHADQPTREGLSSGVGKVLKFAEHMVGVYNLKTGHMSRDLDLLESGEKVVVFNLSEIFEQLAQIDPSELNGVSYDGRVLLFPKRDKGPAQPKP